MLEKSPSHRKGCMLGLLCALGGSDPLFPTGSGRFESITVDKDIVQKKYTEDVETCIRIGARDRDIEVRKIAKKCWEIYRVEFSSRVARCVDRLPTGNRIMKLFRLAASQHLSRQ